MPPKILDIPARTIRMENEKPKFTGRSLVLLNNSVKPATVSNQAKRASLRLASTLDYAKSASPDIIEKALSEADGIVFEKIRVAVLNEGKVEEIDNRRSDKSIARTFLNSEPERFVYAIQAKGKKKQQTGFADNKTASWGMHAINVLASAYTGKGIPVAVLDTGVDTAHPDLQSRIKRKKSFISGQQVMDLNGHGTHCAGLIAGYQHIAKKFRYGTAPGVQLYIAKVLSNQGVGTDGSILAGIDWALENKCRIISMSLGGEAEPGEAYSAVYESVAKEALASNCLIIAAAGNESERSSGLIAPVGHPANCPSIMAVAALDQQLTVADFSCGGLNPDGGQVDIAAPGVNIWSTWKNKGYRRESGTSMAAPIVSGIAALLTESDPKASAASIWMQLIQQAKRLDLPATDTGAGLACCRK